MRPLRPSAWMLAPFLWCALVRLLLAQPLVPRWPASVRALLAAGVHAPPLVVVTPVALALQTQTRSDGLRRIFEVAGRDASGCIRYAGATEVLQARAEPVYVYLRPLPVHMCPSELSP